MAKKIHHIDSITVNKGNMTLQLNTDRLNRNLNNAQFALDSAVMASMVPYMPMQDGTFIELTRAESAALAGSGKVVAARKPFGRYLYEGYVMVDSVTGKGPMKIPVSPGEYILRFRKGAKLVRTDRKLSYYKGKNHKVQSHWFEKAKEEDIDSWRRDVANEMKKP